MKKIMMLLIVAVFMLGIAGNAMAAFNNGDLIRVVYQNTATGTKEIATDLGVATTLGLTAPITSNIVFNTNNVDLSSANFTGISGTSDLYVAYYVSIIGNSSGPNAKAWLSGTSTIGAMAAGGYAANGTGIQNYYQSLTTSSPAGTPAQVTANNTSGGSFVQLMEIGQNGRGSFTAMQPYGGGTMNLAGITTAGYVDQVLYYYARPNAASSGVAIGTMRTYADGHSALLAANTVPVPAAIYLLGSGLLGLVGLRRKISV